MDEELRFDGRVVVVTGAGGGLGRQYALMFGGRGAKVVVNDLGGDEKGSGSCSTAADNVVDEIRATGGQAVANYASVEDGAQIIQTALDNFGTVDVIINNAGILRDVSFHKMTEEDWTLLQRVHLNGTRAVTQAAWPILRDKGYGRVVMTTSAAAIYGNFGQANYAAAKLGILGLANALAEEGRSRNIQVNTIAPIAASRMTATAFPQEFLANLRAEAISPLVGWLAHENCSETKGLFEVGAGYIAKLRWERALGYAFGADRAFTLDDVARHWDRIVDFTDAEHPLGLNDSLEAVERALRA
jgi:3-hydroxyacyl-CoA dehydrogenase/3a,7a,12a-trihydroxy-5b-cholest-24-enoyl-CoA hydratase